MIRKYGSPPYNTFVIHGGPGALGSVACIARELSKTMGVIEPLQSQYSISGLVKELNDQIISTNNTPVTLIGHSWGAFLSLLYAECHPGKVKQIVLVGCAPLVDAYVPLINERRLQNLSLEEGNMYLKLLAEANNPDKKDFLKYLGELAEKSDNYDPVKFETDDIDSFPVDSKMYSSIWEEARTMRSNEELIRRIRKVKAPVFIIQGENDPHPVEGVIEPLELIGIPFKHYVLTRCGHSPFREKMAMEQFYYILKTIIDEKH